MMTFGGADLWLSLIAIPLVVVAIDVAALFRIPKAPVIRRSIRPGGPRSVDYTVIVPIYGSVTYLENVDYLRQYGDRVLLVTSGGETTEFYADLERIASDNGFRIHISPKPAYSTDGRSRRQVGGTLRDTIVRDAHRSIDTGYIVCIDADTWTVDSLDRLVGSLVANELDIASVRLVPANRDTLLARLQGHEYAMAMRMRRVMPWLVSGACHVARREVHRDLMSRHSLFFQGNDVELGLLAVARGYRIGHVPFDARTTVPARLRPWWRQRLAWGGGEFRVMVVNIHLGIHHPWLYLYGFMLLFALAPLRWYFLIHAAWPTLVIVFGLYLVAVVTINWRHRSWDLAVYPLYSLLYTLVIIPTAWVSYVRMAVKYKNTGIIRPTWEPTVSQPVRRVAR